MQTVKIKNVTLGPTAPLAIIAGPCVAESLDLCLRIGEAMRDRCDKLKLGYIFKASFDKANRSSAGSFRGPGLDEGLALMAKVKAKLGVPVTTDIHESHQAAPTAEVVDLLQIPAFLCRQTDLLVAAAATGRPVNVKKGQFLSPREMGNAVEKLREGASLIPSPSGRGQGEGISGRPGCVTSNASGRRSSRQSNDPTTLTAPSPRASPSGRGGGIILTERGTFFGYHRLVNDFVGVGDLMELGWPVCFDVTHSTQKPGEAATSGGRPERAPLLARCAIAAGVQALFLETHPRPAKARSDAATMLPLPAALALLDDVARLHRVTKNLGR